VYKTGTNRLFYSSETAVGKTVEIDILTPNLKQSNKKLMNNIGDIFYVDVCFSEQGSHFMRVFENNIHKHSEILVVSGSSGLIFYSD
jgi:ABC-type enterochelin transport system substrate-binding protein